MRSTALALTAALLVYPIAAFAQDAVVVPGRQPTTLDDQLARKQPPAGYAVRADYQPTAGIAADYIPPVEELVRTSENNIKYATGGVGEEEEAQLKSLENQFNLKLLSTLEDGAYLGYYSVRVTDTNGKSVFEAPGDGPYFYTTLPAGTYNVEVLRRDHPTKSQKVTLGNGGLKSLQFRWPGAAGAKTPAGKASGNS
jgi:hypothetical protein